MSENVQIKKRNFFLQILLMIVTFGLYSIYWYYVTFKELNSFRQIKHESPILYTILLFIPFLSLISLYQYSHLYEDASNAKLSKWILFLLWIFFPIAVWLIVQMDLNERAEGMAS